MPYISPQERKYINPTNEGTGDRDTIDMPYISGVGELNFAVTTLVDNYLSALREFRKAGENNYEEYNSVIGVLESAKLEIYRRLVAPYENKKIVLNGDVYSNAQPATQADKPKP